MPYFDRNNLPALRQNGAMSPKEGLPMPMQSPVGQIMNQAKDTMENAMNRREGLISRLFPDAIARRKVQHELSLISTEMEFRKRALTMMRETQIQSMQEMCNQYLVQEKAQGRAETATFLMAKKAEMQEQVDRIFDSFMTSMDNKINEIDKYKSPAVRAIREQQLERDLINFGEMQAQLMDKFQRIVSEGV